MEGALRIGDAYLVMSTMIFIEFFCRRMYHSQVSSSPYVPQMVLYGTQTSYGDPMVQSRGTIAGLENLAVRQSHEISHLSASQGLYEDMRERLEIMTARCYQLEESSRMHDRDRALLMGLRSKNESLQTTCNTLTGRCKQMEQIIQKQEEELGSLKQLRVENLSLIKSNEVLKGQLDQVETLFAKQSQELASVSSLRADNLGMRGTVQSLESKINHLEKALRDQTRLTGSVSQPTPPGAHASREDHSRLLMV
jgi:hypothetical protein